MLKRIVAVAGLGLALILPGETRAAEGVIEPGVTLTPQLSQRVVRYGETKPGAHKPIA